MVDVVISGIGQSDVARRLAATGLSLTIDAAMEALDDAGLSAGDIDGLSTFPGPPPPCPDSARSAHGNYVMRWA